MTTSIPTPETKDLQYLSNFVVVPSDTLKIMQPELLDQRVSGHGFDIIRPQPFEFSPDLER